MLTDLYDRECVGDLDCTVFKSNVLTYFSHTKLYSISPTEQMFQVSDNTQRNDLCCVVWFPDKGQIKSAD